MIWMVQPGLADCVQNKAKATKYGRAGRGKFEIINQNLLKMNIHEPIVLRDQDRVVVRTGVDTYTTDVRTREHVLIADEPIDKGGANQGPTAYDLLLAALGSCTSITLRMYAARKEWDVGEITVRLRHDKIHAEDCEDCEKATGRIDCIQREIEFSGDLTEEQTTRLLFIADKCPVHKTLKGPIAIRTSLTKPSQPLAT